MQNERHDRVVVGRQIKRLRQEQELTVQELATKAKVSPGYLSEVERGIPAVSIDKLRQIADGLGVAIDDLLDESSPESAKSERRPDSCRLVNSGRAFESVSSRNTDLVTGAEVADMARRAKGEQHAGAAMMA